MITLHELDTAIAKCQGEENPNAQTCSKLADFLTIKNYLFRDATKMIAPVTDRGYSNAAPPANLPETIIDYDSGTEFSQAIDGKDAYSVWQIMDELLTVLQATNPRLYDGVLHKIDEL